MAAQLEQLLTCCICLDRYRNPKLLPCQHSVCMEPCMEGLVDYVRRQVKCPECRAEHRIPYNGIQGFPANVTLQRFLEAHIEITGETPDPFTGQIMERCSVCNEKNYLICCAHCDKKICIDCKAAHTDILKREIGRINNQVKRSSHRLNDQLCAIERNITALKQNSDGVTEEVDIISKRLQQAIKDRAEFLRNEVLNYYNNEHRNLVQMKAGIEQEINNVQSNCELADKHMSDQTNWDDCELMDAKDIFLRTTEFIRNFDYEGGDYNRRAKFSAHEDINKLASTLSSLGELVINGPKPGVESFSSNTGHQSGLSKSKSDHRLAAQFRDEENSYSYNANKTSPVTRRRFGERLHPPEEPVHDASQTDIGRRRFRSRFMRREEDDDRLRVPDEDQHQSKHRTKVIDTEDVARGPLSGITRMVDSPRVIQRLQEKEGNFKKKKEPPKPQTPILAKPTALTFGTPRRAARQMSEDEIEKIKKQNETQASTSSSVSTAAAVPALRSAFDRLNSIKDSERLNRSNNGSRTNSPSSPTTQQETDTERRMSREHGIISRDYGSSSSTAAVMTPTRKASVESSKALSFSRSSSTSSIGDSGKSGARKVSKTDPTYDRTSRSNSTDSNRSTDSPKAISYQTDENPRSRFQKTLSLDSKTTSPTSKVGSNRYQSRFFNRTGTPPAETQKESTNEEETSDETESEESEESSEEEREDNITTSYSKPSRSNLLSTNSGANDSGYTSGSSTSRPRPSDINDSNYRKPSYAFENQKNTEVNEDTDTKYPYSNRFLGRSRTAATPNEENFQSRFLNKSKSYAILKPDNRVEEEPHSTPTSGGSAAISSGMGSSRAKFEELKERRQRLARSKSSAGGDDDDSLHADTSTASTPTYRSRYAPENTTTNRYNREPVNSTNSAASNNQTSSNKKEDSSGPNQLSNWARYLKNKYGNKAGNSNQTSNNTPNSATVNKASSAISRSRSSHILGLPKDNDQSSEEDSKNVHATPTSHRGGTSIHTTFANFNRSQPQKQRLLFKIGSRGSEPEHFTWPRGIAIGPDDCVVVADSSNHRVQIFDRHGRFVKSFGSYGNGEGEFDCLAGVAVNRIGQYIIADRYNHRIQIFDCSGMFIRAFGSQGTGDGKFSYPWGLTTDSLGFIYVCDKENHRIQVFQFDGTFVGKFGTLGSKLGELEHPHYIAMGTNNQIFVSDSNNHRIQIFDMNGDVIKAFGSEGTDVGQFKFPRGVAVDSKGKIYVADSGNNRIQIFDADGEFLKEFGSWGSASGEFKGLEGVGVMSNGNILICDRENHRIQVF